MSSVHGSTTQETKPTQENQNLAEHEAAKTSQTQQYVTLAESYVIVAYLTQFRIVAHLTQFRICVGCYAGARNHLTTTTNHKYYYGAPYHAEGPCQTDAAASRDGQTATIAVLLRVAGPHQVRLILQADHHSTMKAIQIPIGYG